MSFILNLFFSERATIPANYLHLAFSTSALGLIAAVKRNLFWRVALIPATVLVIAEAPLKVAVREKNGAFQKVARKS